jgi:serine/threonine-protein kinase
MTAMDTSGDLTRTSAPGTTGSGEMAHGRFAPGTLLAGRYRVVSRLGAGGMGEVYRADDLTLGQSVALKFLPPAVEHDPVRLERLVAEIRTARQVAHPNVCRVYDVGEIPAPGTGHPTRFLTMEYVDGEDLQSLLRRIGRLAEDKGLEIARQICAGLAAIHDRGVLHRDLKPANIMIDGRGRVRLTDFGLALASGGSGAAAGEIAGTPAYMAPEQFAGAALTPATDLYALGLVLYELLTGARVQTGEDPHAIRSAQHHLAQTVTTSASGAKLDPLVQRVIARCLEHEPLRRPQSAVIVAAALPGGDPLAAAIAAGETPSPQMVAAAGAEGGLSFKVAVPLLVAIIAGVVAVGWIEAPRSLSRVLPLPLSPEVLAAKAHEVLGRLGYGQYIADRAYGFGQPITAQYQQWLDAQPGPPVRWHQRPRVRPALRTFWHRTSPREMLPLHAGPVTLNDPARISPGMTALQLDEAGRLVRFDAVPVPWTAPATDKAPDWPVVFEAAGLTAAEFVEAAPEWVGDSPGDLRRAWVGPGATETGAPLRVEAAWRGGALVFARLIAPWTPKPDLRVSESPWSFVLQQAVLSAFILGTIAAAVLIAQRHVRGGRADTRGAARMATAIGAIASVTMLLELNRWPRVDLSLVEMLAWPTVMALLAWSFYAAVEPAVRRDWPQMLIAWSRLLDGRWRDPLVGRSLLVGSALGVATLVAGSGWSRLISDGVSSREVLTVRTALINQLSGLQGALFLAFGMALLLVLVRRGLGSERRALALLIGGLALLIAPTNPREAPLIVLQLGGPIVVATRWGLLTSATMIMFLYLNRSDYFAVSTWATTAMIVLLAGKLAPGLFGFYTATRGRVSARWLE